MTASQIPVTTTRRRLAVIGAVAACTLAACQVPPVTDDWSPSVPVPPDPPSANGSIYKLGRDSTLFENATAQRVGDILTIRLMERTSAVKSATTSTSKSTGIGIPGPIIGGRPVTVNGVPILETEISSDQSFDGQGDSSQSNRLDGAITVTVAQRLPNGNLVVRGQKWLKLNQGHEFVRIEGIVRAIDVEPDNSVPSWKVADARIAYGGRGALEDSNSMGWIARFFNSPIMPF
jgi:flagellar L-ring protein FlgH